MPVTGVVPRFTHTRVDPHPWSRLGAHDHLVVGDGAPGPAERRRSVERLSGLVRGGRGVEQRVDRSTVTDDGEELVAALQHVLVRDRPARVGSPRRTARRSARGTRRSGPARARRSDGTPGTPGVVDGAQQGLREVLVVRRLEQRGWNTSFWWDTARIASRSPSLTAVAAAASTACAPASRASSSGVVSVAASSAAIASSRPRAARRGPRCRRPSAERTRAPRFGSGATRPSDSACARLAHRVRESSRSSARRCSTSRSSGRRCPRRSTAGSGGRRRRSSARSRPQGTGPPRAQPSRTNSTIATSRRTRRCRCAAPSRWCDVRCAPRGTAQQRRGCGDGHVGPVHRDQAEHHDAHRRVDERDDGLGRVELPQRVADRSPSTPSTITRVPRRSSRRRWWPRKTETTAPQLGVVAGIPVAQARADDRLDGR